MGGGLRGVVAVWLHPHGAEIQGQVVSNIKYAYCPCVFIEERSVISSYSGKYVNKEVMK